MPPTKKGTRSEGETAQARLCPTGRHNRQSAPFTLGSAVELSAATSSSVLSICARFTIAILQPITAVPQAPNKRPATARSAMKEPAAPAIAITIRAEAMVTELPYTTLRQLGQLHAPFPLGGCASEGACIAWLSPVVLRKLRGGLALASKPIDGIEGPRVRGDASEHVRNLCWHHTR